MKSYEHEWDWLGGENSRFSRTTVTNRNELDVEGLRVGVMRRGESGTRHGSPGPPARGIYGHDFLEESP